MPNTNTWIILANSSRAKIFRWVHHSKIEVIAVLDHPESRYLNQEFNSDAPGRTFDKGGITKHSYQPETEPKHEESEKFAKTLAHYLLKALEKGDYYRIYLLASPTFLGLLNRHLDKNVQDTIFAKIPKDITEFSSADIEHYLASVL